MSEPEHISLACGRALDQVEAAALRYRFRKRMDRVWDKYEAIHGLVSEETKALSETALFVLEGK